MSNLKPFETAFLSKVFDAFQDMKEKAAKANELETRVAKLCGTKNVRLVPYYSADNVYEISVRRDDSTYVSTLFVYPCGTLRIVKDFMEAHHLIDTLGLWGYTPGR